MLRFFSKSIPEIIVRQLQLPKTGFDYKNEAHLELIRTQIAQFKTALHALKEVDGYIVSGLTVGTGSYIGSYIFPLVLVSIAGYCVASYNIAARKEIQVKYRETLNDLISVYKWSMGKDTADHWHKLAVPTLQELIMTLGTWVPSNTIHTWSDNDLKPACLSFESRRVDLPLAFEKRLTQLAAGTQATEWAFRLYGEQGLENLFDVMRENLVSQANNLSTKLFTPNHQN